MSLKSALEALKRRDFATVRSLLANESPKTFTIQLYQVKGIAEMSMLDWQAAFDTFSAAALKFPAYAAFWLNRGISAENTGRIDDAISSNEHCLTINGIQVEAMGNLSNLYRRRNRFTDAEAMARKALEAGMKKGDANNLLALALLKQGKLDEADEALRVAQAEDTHNPMLIANRANILVDKLQFFDAWRMFAAARALKDEPVFRRDEGYARMLSGDYDRGLPLAEARLLLPAALRVKSNCPIWNGDSLKGKKLLIVAEQGFGDVIHFARYQSMIHDGELFWAVPPEMVRLLTGAVRGTVLPEDGPLPDCDVYAPVMSLPFLLGYMRPESTPLKIAVKETPKLPQGSHKLKIGIAWSGSQTNERNKERSIPLERWKPILETGNADFYAPMFANKALDEIGSLPVIRLDSLIGEMADSAALIKQMNAVITVDTSVAHLAGTLGIKTFLLLAYCPDWRWGASNDKTPWYSSMTLLRQPKRGDWDSVIQKMADILKRGI
jgi:tetratricopeptide (TPR) repeat protein